MTDETASNLIRNARAELIQNHRFYGVLVSQVEPIESNQFPTMATNGKQHFYNPTFICGLSKNHRGVAVPRERLILGVQAHETEHDARHHGTRRFGRDARLWNEACDYGINIDLIDSGFDLPYGALIDERFRGLSAEDIFRIRELESQQKQKQDEPEKPDSDESEDSDENETESGNEGESDENESDETGESGQDRESYSDNQDRESYSCDAESNDETTAGDNGDSNARGNGSDAESDNAESGQSCGDPGQCGEVLDSACDDSSLADEDSAWQRIVRQAASMARAAGTMPGHMAEILERENAGETDWHDVLRQWIESGSNQVETWNRPNRRLHSGNVYLPSKKKDGINHVVFIRDTSGSVCSVALGKVCDDIQGALDSGIIDRLTTIDIDTQVNEVREYAPGDTIDSDAKGRGGTILGPAFDYVAEHCEDASLIVCFTDMEFWDLHSRPEPDCPTLFAAFGYPQAVRAALDSAPWGSPGIDVGVWR